MKILQKYRAKKCKVCGRGIRQHNKSNLCFHCYCIIRKKYLRKK
jgi:hypothetical protein